MKKLCTILAGFIFSLGGSNSAQAQFPSFADLAEKLMPSVVNISTVTAPGDPESEETATASEALGSGFIMDGSGYIITNHHVVDKAESIEVILSDNTKVQAELVGKDPKTDIALIKITPPYPLTAVKFGDSDKIRVGDWVLAIGNPFGLGSSVTAGIVSAKSRDIESGAYDNFIQTDASINQGNSGGPMFNLSGEVIGINSALFSTNGNSQGVGFAIPVNLADWVIKQLRENGEVKRGWIGVKIQPNSEEIASSLGLKASQGVVVSGAAEASPAAKAGLQVGDIILSFNGKSIDNTKNLSRLIAEIPVGTQAPAVIWRNQRKINITVPIELMPEEPAPVSSESLNLPADDLQDDNALLGISISEISPEIIDRYALRPDASGVIVTDVLPNSDAAHKGLKIGDIIVKVDKKDVVDAQSFHDYIADARHENKRPVLLAIQGNEALHFVAVKLMTDE